MFWRLRELYKDHVHTQISGDHWQAKVSNSASITTAQNDIRVVEGAEGEDSWIDPWRIESKWLWWTNTAWSRRNYNQASDKDSVRLVYQSIQQSKDLWHQKINQTAQVDK